MRTRGFSLVVAPVSRSAENYSACHDRRCDRRDFPDASPSFPSSLFLADLDPLSTPPPFPSLHRCLEALFDYLELGYRNRVESKLGRWENVGRLELPVLAATNAVAGALSPMRSHVCKSVSRVYNTKQPLDIGFDPSPELCAALRPVFHHYCGVGERGNYSRMSRQQWLRLCGDCGLLDHLDDKTTADLTFDRRIVASAVAGDHARRLSFRAFLGAIRELASLRVGSGSRDRDARSGAPRARVRTAASASTESFVMDAILPFARRLDTDPDGLASLVRSPGVSEAFAARSAALRRVFRYYSRWEESASSGRYRVDWRDVSKGDGGMSLDEWFAFARDFNLGPGTNRVDSGPLSRAAVAASFREANHGRGSDDDEDALSFDEFRDALARCAARGFSDETNARANARANASVSVSSPDVTFAGWSPRGSPAATLPRDAFGRVVDVPRGKNTRRNVSPNGVASSYASSHASSWSASSPSLVRAFARAPAPRRERSYAYKESLAPGSPTPTKYDVEYPTQYCPVGGLPAVYHSEMVDMVRRRERSDEVAEARRKVGLARERARRLEANRAKRAERERRQVAAGQMIAGFPSEFEENRREGAVVGPNGDVVNLPRRPGPERDVALAARRAAAFEDDDEDRDGATSRTTLPDVHACYAHGTKMRNVLTVRRGDGGQMYPTNRAFGKMAGVDGGGVSTFSSGGRYARYPGLGFPGTPVVL